MNYFWKIVLLCVVTGILVLFALGLNNNPRDIPSPLIERKAPQLVAERLNGDGSIDLNDYRGQWVLINFWGSWCVSCVAEHPHLMRLARRLENRKKKDIVIFGVDFKDTREAARRFLARHGDPGYPHAFDPDQRVAIEWGVYGAPETFVVDPEGVIRLKQAGPINAGWFEKRILPLLKSAQKSTTPQ